MSPKAEPHFSSLKKGRRPNPFFKHPEGKLQLPVVFSVVAVPLLLFGAGYLKGQERQSISKSTNSMAEHLSYLSPTPMFWGAFFSRLLQVLFSSQFFCWHSCLRWQN